MTFFQQTFYGFGRLKKICFFIQVLCLSFISCLQKFKIFIKKRGIGFLKTPNEHNQ